MEIKDVTPPSVEREHEKHTDMLDDISSVVGESKVSETVDALVLTKDTFCPEQSLPEIWEQERPYFKAFGMTAFDSGYCGKSLPNTKTVSHE